MLYNQKLLEYFFYFIFIYPETFLKPSCWKDLILVLLRRIKWIIVLLKYILIVSLQISPFKVTLSSPSWRQVPSHKKFHLLHSLACSPIFGMCVVPLSSFGLHQLQFQLISLGTKFNDSNTTQSKASASAWFLVEII